MRHIEYNFSGTSLKIPDVPDELLHHDFLVVVDGVIKTPHNEWKRGGDYRIEGNLILFEIRLNNVCIQLILVADAILALSKSYAKRRSPYEPVGLKGL